MVFFFLLRCLLFYALFSVSGRLLAYEGIPIYVTKNEAAPASCHSEDWDVLHCVNRSLTIATSAQGFI